jgi:hypothetical protein
MKLKLWSIQFDYKLDELLSKGKIICVENKFDKYWDKEYRWMADQMAQKLGQPQYKNQYPVWAWYQHESDIKPRPDLRKSAHLPTGNKGIRIEFEKEDEEVLLSDFILWHFPLSYKSLIADNERANKRFDKKLRELGLDKTDFENLPHEIKLEIEDSWQKIFDMNFKSKYYTDVQSKKMIQACVWEISEEEIRLKGLWQDKFK